MKYDVVSEFRECSYRCGLTMLDNEPFYVFFALARDVIN